MLKTKYINGLKIQKRTIFECDLIEGINLYELQSNMKNIVQVKVNDIEIPIKIVKLSGIRNDTKRALDISFYFIKYGMIKYKQNIIKITVDRKEVN